jgi:hypothetical protein
LEGSFGSGGRSAAIWFHIRKKLSIRLISRRDVQEEGDGHVDPCHLHGGYSGEQAHPLHHCTVSRFFSSNGGDVLIAKISNKKPHFNSQGATSLKISRVNIQNVHDTLSFRQEHGHGIASHEEDHSADEYGVDIAWVSDLVKDRRNVLRL